MSDVANAAREGFKDTRPIHTYPIPPTLQSEDFKHTSVGLRLLNVDEELDASKLGRYDLLRTQYEAAKLSICEVDGKPIANDEGAIDRFFEDAGPRLRSLMIEAYKRMASPTREETTVFFGGESVKTSG